MQNPYYLHMVGMDELMSQTFPVKEAVIDRLLGLVKQFFHGFVPPLD